jgi:hypothetical protein
MSLTASQSTKGLLERFSSYTKIGRLDGSGNFTIPGNSQVGTSYVGNATTYYINSTTSYLNALQLAGSLTMVNTDIVGVNSLTFNDPGPGEGIIWGGGNGWSIYVSPNDLSTNSAGNLQFVRSGTRYMTLDTSSNLYVGGTITGSTIYVGNASTYYINNATSNLNSLTLAGNLTANTGTVIGNVLSFGNNNSPLVYCGFSGGYLYNGFAYSSVWSNLRHNDLIQYETSTDNSSWTNQTITDSIRNVFLGEKAIVAPG